MLSGESNSGQRWKTAILLIMQKRRLCMCRMLFLYISLLLFCTTTTWNFQKLLSYTFYGGNVVRVLVHFFHCRSFSPCIGCRSHFSFCHRRYKIFMSFFQQKNVSPLFFISRSRSLSPFLSLSFAGLPLFLSLFHALYSKFVDMTIHLSVIL